MDLSFSSVVFATDFSASVRAAGRYAAQLAQHFDAELIVVHAFTLVPAAEEAEVLGTCEVCSGNILSISYPKR